MSDKNVVRPAGYILGIALWLSVAAVWQSEALYTKYLVAFLGIAIASLASLADRQMPGPLRAGRALIFASLIGLSLPLVTMLFSGAGTYTVAQWLWVVLVLAVGWLGPNQPLISTASAGWPGFAAWAVAGSSLIGLMQVARILPGAYDSYGGFDAPATFGLSNFAVEFIVPLLAVIWPGPKVSGTARWVRISVAALGLAYALASGSRAAILGLGAAALVFGLITSGLAARVQLGLGSLVIAGLGALVLLRPGASDTFRLEAWQSAWHMWLDNPWGVGTGWFADAIQSYLSPDAMARQVRTMHRVGDPHNELIRILTELGPVGAALIFGLVVQLVQNRDRLKVDPWLAAGLGSWCAMALVAFPGHTVSGALSAGLLLARWRETGLGQATQSRMLRGWYLVVMAVVVAASVPAWQLTRSARSQVTAQNYMRRKLPLPANAMVYYREALRAASYDRSAQLGLMTTTYGLKDYGLTVRTAETYLDAPFVSPDALIQGMVAAVESGTPARADAWYRAHLDLMKRLSLLDRMSIAMVLQQGKQYASAGEILRAPDILATVDGRLMLAQTLFDSRQYAEALVLIDEGLRLPSATIGLKLARALALEHLGRLDEAQAYLESIVADRPTYAQTYLYLGRIAWLRNDQEATWRYVSTAFGYDKSLNIAPNDEDDPVFYAMYQYVAKRVTMDKLGPNASEPNKASFNPKLKR